MDPLAFNFARVFGFGFGLHAIGTSLASVSVLLMAKSEELNKQRVVPS